MQFKINIFYKLLCFPAFNMTVMIETSQMTHSFIYP